MMKKAFYTSGVICLAFVALTAGNAAASTASSSGSLDSSSKSWELTQKDQNALKYGVTSAADAAACATIANSDGPRPDIIGWPFCSQVEITEEQYQAALAKQHHPVAISSDIGQFIQGFFFSS